MIADGLVPASPILQSTERTQAHQFTQKEARKTLNSPIDETEEPRGHSFESMWSQYTLITVPFEWIIILRDTAHIRGLGVQKAESIVDTY